MQLRKFYGKNMAGALARVRQALGTDAFILETREIAPGSPAERGNPGARFEVVAARELEEKPGLAAPHGILPASNDEQSHSMRAKAAALSRKLRIENSELESPEAFVPSMQVKAPVTAARGAAMPRYSLLADLAALKAQLNTLLDEAPGRSLAQPNHPAVDIHDYHELIAMGVDHELIAPHFRAWLRWRTAPTALRRYMVESGSVSAARMMGESLREWLLYALINRPTLTFSAQASGPKIVGLVGPTGAGKSTTLAKIASIFGHKSRHNSVVVTLDTHRFGATEQWRKISKLMGIEVHEISKDDDLQHSIESWGNFEWVGIDTPGGMQPESEIGRTYGRLLAQCPVMETGPVLPTTQHLDFSRQQMKTTSSMPVNSLIFSKLDESRQTPGALGNLINLSLGSEWPLAGFTTGTRVPEDFSAADRDGVWRHMLAPNTGDASLSMDGGIA